eukprot:15438586-Alexandrium_andersonii.AAC.1
MPRKKRQAADVFHDWEQPSAHSWEVPPPPPPPEWGDSSNEECSPEDAGVHLAEKLISMKNRGHLTAKDVCIISHWASLAGAKGPVNEYAMAPGGNSGNYSRHIDIVMHMQNEIEKLCFVSVPGYDRRDLSRSLHDVAVIPPHEALHAEL